MSSIDDLVAYRQKSLDLFIANGLKHNTYQSQSAISPFVRDAGLLTHPLYSLSLITSADRRERDLETNLSQHLGSNLSLDSLQIANPSSYSARDNKYGVSSIEFDREGALFAVSGSNGVIRVYDFDETYYHMCQSSPSSSVDSSETTIIQPIVRFDTRRDISCLCWSHLRPDDIAVGFLFRPEVHIYDLGDIAETAGQGEEAPSRVLEADTKGRSGHNTLLFWHTVKWESTTSTYSSTSGISATTTMHTHGHNKKTLTSQCKKETEGLIGGSLSGHLRFWLTSSSRSSRTTSRNFLWQVLADPHRTAHTASAVVALLPIHSARNHSSVHSTKHSSLLEATTVLLAATAQGVLTMWDLSHLRPANFGSTLPEPQCLRRIDYTTQLMLFETITLIGACITTPRLCCESCCDTGREWKDAAVSSATESNLTDNIQVIRNSTQTKSARKTSFTATATGSATITSERLLLTLSTGDMYLTDIQTEALQRCHAGGQHADTSAYASVEDEARNSKHPNRKNASQLSEGLCYEELKRELALRSTSGGSSSNNLSAASIASSSAVTSMPHRTVLPAVVPAWHASAGHLHRQQGAAGSTTFMHTAASALLRALSVQEHHNAEPLPSLVAVVAHPTAQSSGTNIVTVDISPLPGAAVYPYIHDQYGLSGVSGKARDPWTGQQTSNMRRVSTPATTLPGAIFSAVPGSHDVTTSCDLQAYLCSSSAVGTSFSKSHEITFDWSYQHSLSEQTPLDGNILEENGVPYQKLSSNNAVTHISAHSIVLEHPYMGPAVSGGLPVVRVRTALLPGGRTANSISTTGGVDGGRSHKQKLSVMQCTDTQLTALCAHPCLPCLIGGTQKDEVRIFNPTAMSALSEDEQRELRGECVMELQSRSGSRYLLGKALPRRLLAGHESMDTDLAEATEEVPPTEEDQGVEDSPAEEEFYTTLASGQLKKRTHSEIEPSLYSEPALSPCAATARRTFGSGNALTATVGDPTVPTASTLQGSLSGIPIPSHSSAGSHTTSTLPAEISTAQTLQVAPTTVAPIPVLPLATAAPAPSSKRNTLSSLLRAQSVHSASIAATATTNSTGCPNKIHNHTTISSLAAQKFKIQTSSVPTPAPIKSAPSKAKLMEKNANTTTARKTTNIMQFFTTTKR